MMMRPPRFTTRRLLLVVAALAVALGILAGLQRRRERFRRLAAEYASAVRAVYVGQTEVDMALADYHDELAAKYRAAADRPWLALEPDRPPTEAIKAFWTAHEAVKEAYPGVALDQYVAQIVADEPDPEDPPGTIDWAIRYRRRDNRSGMNVYLEDPVRIEIHDNGPPPDPPGPKRD